MKVDIINSLEWFERSIKGKKVRASPSKAKSNPKIANLKHYHSKKTAASYQRSLPAMLRTAQQLPQAVLKISSYGKDLKHINNHLSYISRNGKLVLEDQDEGNVKNKKDQEKLLAEWQREFSDRANSRHTVHMVLSVPEDSPRDKAREAAKLFLKEEFGKKFFEYVFVAHDDTTHPHVHVVIKMYRENATKLNLSPKELYRLRESYAKHCRSQGINLDASLRWERGLSGKAEKSTIVQMRKTDRQPTIDKKLIQKVKLDDVNPLKEDHPSTLKIRKRNQMIRKYYIDKAKAISISIPHITKKSEKEDYKKAASLLNKFAQVMPIEKTRANEILINLEKCSGNNRYNEKQQESLNVTEKINEASASVTELENRKKPRILSEIFERKISITTSHHTKKNERIPDSKLEKFFEQLAKNDYQEFAKLMFMTEETKPWIRLFLSEAKEGNKVAQIIITQPSFFYALHASAHQIASIPISMKVENSKLMMPLENQQQLQFSIGKLRPLPELKEVIQPVTKIQANEIGIVLLPQIVKGNVKKEEINHLKENLYQKGYSIINDTLKDYGRTLEGNIVLLNATLLKGLRDYSENKTSIDKTTEIASKNLIAKLVSKQRELAKVTTLEVGD